MERTRRLYDRSLPKEQPDPKKPRLSAVPASSEGRPGFNQQRRVHMDRDSESSDSLPGELQELVSQYKIALSELTFNSKPIITNLSIIAGENLHAAKAIAATVCTHIIEVPPERKLPSLYLLDSIVKNIGKDYVKYFASRLPEVFCTAYWQVDPSAHQGMRHLFGTWKGVFPPQSLQVIEKELGFSSTSNGSSSGMAISRPDSQGQRSAHSIHVNPKYLEARQRLQTSRARGSDSDISGATVSSHEIGEAPRRSTAISSEKSWADPFAKVQIHHRDQANEPVRDKYSTMATIDSDSASNVPGLSGLAASRVSGGFKDQGLNKPWHDYGSSIGGELSSLKNGAGTKPGLDSYAAQKSAIPGDQSFDFRSVNGIGKTFWKNSEEEEYMWDEMNSRPTDRVTASTSVKDQWMSDNDERMEVDVQFQEPQNLHDRGSTVDDEPSVDSTPHELNQVITGSQLPFSWSDELHPPEVSTVSEAGKNILGSSQGYFTGLRSSSDISGRTSYQPQQSIAPIRGQSLKLPVSKIPGIKVTTGQQLQTHRAAPSSMHQRLSSPSLSKSSSNQPPYTASEQNQLSTGPPLDPRKPSLQSAMGSRDQSSSVRLQSSTTQPPSQKRKYIPSTQQGKLEDSEFDLSGVEQHLLSSQYSRSGNLSVIGKSSDQSIPLIHDAPGRSITNSLLSAGAKDRVLGSRAQMGGSIKPSVRDVRPQSMLGAARPPSPAVHPPGLSQRKLESPPLSSGAGPSSSIAVESEETPNAITSASDPVSSLLSSLVAKGLISASSSDKLPSAPIQKPINPADIASMITSISSGSVSSLPLVTEKPPSITEQSSLEPVKTETRKLIGFDFRPDVIRKFHPDVVADLVSDLPHRCSICGLKFKHQELLDRHMEWHTLKERIQDRSNKMSRRWYTDSFDWVVGSTYLHDGTGSLDLIGESDEALESSEQMVPADESQCACIICGELFEDFYSLDRNEWMFKETVYLTIQSSESQERFESMSASSSQNLIVHSHCMSEDSLHALGLGDNVQLGIGKLEEG